LHSQELVVIAGDNLLPGLFEIMCEVSTENIEAEAANEESIVMYATMAVASIYQAAPAKIFYNFIEPTFLARIKTDTLGALLLLHCLTTEMGHKETFDFIKASFGAVLQCCEQPDVREIALYVLAMIFKSYKDMFATVDPTFPADAIVQPVVDLLVVDVDTPVLVLERFAVVIYYLVQIRADDNFRSPMPGPFHTLVDFLRMLMSRPIETKEEMTMFETACEALNQLILHGCRERQCDDLRELFRVTLDELEASHASVEADYVRFSVQAHLSSNLASLALRIGENLEDDELHQAIEYLFGLLEHRDFLMYEEAVLALRSLYIPLYKSFTREEVDRMMLIVQDALSSECPGVINSASLLLGDLFRFGGPDFIDQFEDCFALADSLLREHEDVREIHPFVVRAVAEMFEGIPCEHFHMLASHEQHLFELMKMVRGVSIDPGRHSDVQYANALFECLAQLYRVFAKLFYPQLTGITARTALPDQQDQLVQERAYLSEMAEFAKAVAIIKKPSEFLLSQFVDMAAQFAEKCSIKNNTVLNRTVVHRVLDMTQETDTTMPLKRKGKRTQILLKNR
jgi:hypothetical protein